MPQEPASLSRHHIRQQQRALRRSLSPAQQRHAAFALRDRLLAQPYLARPCRIALYLPFDGEPDTRPLIAALWQRGHQVVLPVLHPFTRGQLLFLRYTPETTMRRNAFGISEPDLDATRVVPLTRLDLMLTPLVAFDAAGNRLGMGGGFYDRLLPGFGGLTVGVIQRALVVPRLPADAHDCPVAWLATEGGMIHSSPPSPDGVG